MSKTIEPFAWYNIFHWENHKRKFLYSQFDPKNAEFGALYGPEAMERIKELEAEVAELKKKASAPDFLSQVLNEGDGVYRP